MRSRFLSILACSAPLAIGAVACGDDAPGEGEVTVTVYGEAFIEEGIPASEMADGWAVSFDRFLVTIDAVTVGGVQLPAAAPIDISVPTDGAGHVVGAAVVDAGAHDNSNFVITRVELAGSATKDGVDKSFEWVIDQPTRYSACETTTVVPEGDVGTFQITVHADHFFYDSLVAEEPNVVFQALADADADTDGVITEAELAATDIGAFDPGSDGAVDNLWTWLIAQSRTLGHVDGEGHCDFQAHSE